MTKQSALLAPLVGGDESRPEVSSASPTWCGRDGDRTGNPPAAADAQIAAIAIQYELIPATRNVKDFVNAIAQAAGRPRLGMTGPGRTGWRRPRPTLCDR